LLYQEQDYYLTDNNDGTLTVSFKNSYLSSLEKRKSKKIQFIFTDGKPWEYIPSTLASILTLM